VRGVLAGTVMDPAEQRCGSQRPSERKTMTQASCRPRHSTSVGYTGCRATPGHLQNSFRPRVQERAFRVQLRFRVSPPGITASECQRTEEASRGCGALREAESSELGGRVSARAGIELPLPWGRRRVACRRGFEFLLPGNDGSGYGETQQWHFHSKMPEGKISRMRCLSTGASQTRSENGSRSTRRHLR